jgi:hypothetical protein
VGAGNGSGSGKVHGPTLPTSADITLARELVDSQRASEKAYKHAKNKKDTKDRVEELVGPKPVGREGMLEKKALKRESDRAFREKGDEGLEVDEGTLMGGGDSFQAMWVCVLAAPVARLTLALQDCEEGYDEEEVRAKQRGEDHCYP